MDKIITLRNEEYTDQRYGGKYQNRQLEEMKEFTSQEYYWETGSNETEDCWLRTYIHTCTHT